MQLNKMKKSIEMPEPQVMNYKAFYKVTPLFINDLKTVMNNGNVAYCDAKKLFDVINEHNSILPAAILNEFIRSLANFPYKVVSGLMSVIEKDENFKKYFELLEPAKNNTINN